MPENSQNPERYALENIYMLAKRENNRKTQDERSKEMWGHVIRLCESAGLTSTILRSDAVDISPGPSTTTKTKITAVGQPCRDCQTPVIHKEHRKPPKYKGQSFYYAHWLHCPGCKKDYFLNEARVMFEVTQTSAPCLLAPQTHVGPPEAAFDAAATGDGVAPW